MTIAASCLPQNCRFGLILSVRKKKRDKGLASQAALSPGTNARSAGVLGDIGIGVKNRRKNGFCGHIPQKPFSYRH